MTSGPAPTTRRRILASELRRLRTEADMKQAVAEQAADLSGQLSKYENGTAAPSPNDVRRLLELYGAEPAQIERLVELARGSRQRGWLKGIKGVVWPPLVDLIALERDATSIQDLALTLVPGPLQTEAYARAVLQAGSVGTNVDQHVTARLARAAALFKDREQDQDNPPPAYWAILRESVLRCAIGGPAVMREQLNHLVAMAHKPYITLQVIPDSAGAHPGMTSWFMLLRFAVAPAYGIVYSDQMTTASYRDEPEHVERHQDAFQRLRYVALSEIESVKLITSTAKDLYDRDH